MTDELLIKFLNNRCNPEELKKIVQWIDKDALSDESKNIAHKDWRSFKTKKFSVDQNERLNLLLDRIHHKINIKGVKLGTGQRKTTSLITTRLVRAAAILLIPVLSILIYIISNPLMISSQFTDSVVDSLEIIAPVGSRTIVQLSEGTVVHLNYGSKIKYPKVFKGNTREMTLTGEGFFDIAHDPDHPFVVKTKQLNIKALGTKFNVLSYPDDDMVATTLVEGMIVLEYTNENGKTKNIGSLVPGQHVDYNFNTGISASTRGNIEKYIAWKDGLLVFDNSSITEVAERLGRTFNVEIEVAEEIKDYTYTVKLADESLSQILDLITKATPVNYIIFPREKLSDGSFQKQKILLKKRS